MFRFFKIFWIAFLILPSYSLAQTAEIQMFPGRQAESIGSTVSIQLSSESIYGGKYGRYCGGTLIAPRWIITAAHCLYESPRLDVIIGTKNLATKNPVRRAIVYKKIHPGYSDISGSDDIGLAYLNAPAPPNIKPAVISPEFVGEGEYLLSKGWGAVRRGYPSLLREANFKSVKCPFGGNQIFICTEGVKTIVTTCSGDSGGPLFSGNQLVGVVSFSGRSAYVCQDALSRVSGFTRLSIYYEWIQKNIAVVPNNIKWRAPAKKYSTKKPPILLNTHSKKTTDGSGSGGKFLAEILSPYYPIRWAKLKPLNKNELICTGYSPGFPQTGGCWDSKFPAPMLLSHGAGEAGLRFKSQWATPCPKMIILAKINKKIVKVRWNPCPAF